MANGWNLTNFEPAWLKIQNSEKSGPKFSFDRNRSANNPQTSSRSDTSTSSNLSSPGTAATSAVSNNSNGGGRQRHHSFEVFDRTTTIIRTTPFNKGGEKRYDRCRNRSIEPVNDQSSYPESLVTANGVGYFSNQQPQQTRRSYSRERMAGSPYLRNSSSTHTTTHDCVDSNGSSTSGYFNGFRSSCGSSNQRRLHSASSHNNNDEQRSYQKYNGSTATATTRTPTTSVQANRNSTRGSYYHNQYHNNSPSSAHSSHYNYHYGGAQHNGYTTTSAEKGENSANDSGSNNTNTDISNEITNGNQLNGGGFDSLEQDFPSLSGKETSGLKSRLSAGSTNANGNLFNGTDQYSPKSTCPTNDIDGNSIGSTSLSPSSSIWANAAEKLRSCHLDQNIMISPVHPVKILERSTSSSSTTNTLTRASNLFTPSRILTRKDRLLSVPTNSSSASTTLSNSNGNSTLNNSLNSKPIVLELPTNCITQTKNLDKRSEFFNSLKNSPVTLTDIQQQSASTVNGSGSDLKMNDRLSSNRCSLAANSNSTTNNSQQQQVYENLLNVSVNGTVISSHEDECDINDPNMTSSSSTDLTQMSSISMPEPQEEKELLTRMGWKENDDQTYTITEADKEEFENKKRKLLMKGQEKKYSSKCSAALMKQLRERGLPSLKRTDIIYLEMASEESDDDIYCDNNP